MGKLRHRVMIKRFALFLLILGGGSFVFSGCSSAPSVNEIRLEVIKELSARHFATPQEKLAFLRSEINRVEKQLLPSRGTPREAVEAKYGPAKEEGGGRFYEPLPGTFMSVLYKEGKVVVAHLSYVTIGSGASMVHRMKSQFLRTQTPEEELKQQIEDAEFDYVASQILLRTYRK